MKKITKRKIETKKYVKKIKMNSIMVNHPLHPPFLQNDPNDLNNLSRNSSIETSCLLLSDSFIILLLSYNIHPSKENFELRR